MDDSVLHSIVPGKILDALFNDTKSLLILTDDSLKILRISLSARIFFGEKAESLPGNSIIGLFRSDSAELLKKIKVHLKIDGEAYSAVLSIVDYVGAIVSFSTTIRFISSVECKKNFLLFFMRDPESFKKSYLTDVDLEYTLKRFLMGHTDSVLLIDFKERTIIDCNAGAETMFGYSRNELVGRSVLFLAADQENAVHHSKRSFSSYARTGYYQDHIICRRKDGDQFETLATNFAIYNKNKELCYILAINRDITEDFSQIQSLRNLANESCLMAQRMNLILERFKPSIKNRGLSELGFSEKQISVVAELLSGDPIKAIAGKLRISESGVKNHLSAIYRHVGVSSRIEFMKYIQDHHIRIE